MSLQERVTFDMKSAMKNADGFRVGVLRLLLSALKNEIISKRTDSSVSILADNEALVVLKREAKKRKESIIIYNNANRADLAINEEKELNIIKEYLPKEPTKEEIESVVNKIIESGVKDFPTIMKSVKEEFKEAADGQVVAEIIKTALK